MDNVKKIPSLSFSVLTLSVLILFIVLLLAVFKAPIVVIMFFAWLLLIPFSSYLGYTFEEIENSAYESIKPSLSLLALMIAIGAMISVWLCAGTVPTLISWGLKLITPKLFLLVTFVICTLIALPTGTAWGTISTAGVAMMGVGLGLGIPAGMVAGAVVSAAFFGDKFSPLSDGPLLSASVCEVPIMTHVKHMGSTTAIAWGLSAIAYLILGYRFAGSTMDVANINSIQEALSSLFTISWVTTIPMILVVAMLILQISAFWSIMIGCVVGVVIAVFYQGFGFAEVIGFLSTGFKVQTDNAMLASLLNRGGMASMYELVAVMIGTLGMGGILKGTGMLNVIIAALSKHLKGARSLTLMTVAASIAAIAMAGNYTFAIAFVGALMTPLFKKAKLKPENASRIINDFCNCGVPFIPYSVSSIFIVTNLNVPIYSVMPWIFFCYFLFAADIIFGLFNINMTKYSDEEWVMLLKEEAEEEEELREITHAPAPLDAVNG